MHKLISPHGDYDHMGESINFVNNFKVEKIIFNCGEYNDLEKDLIKTLNKNKIKYFSCNHFTSNIIGYKDKISILW